MSSLPFFDADRRFLDELSCNRDFLEQPMGPNPGRPTTGPRQGDAA
jgi:hypothetical protein